MASEKADSEDTNGAFRRQGSIRRVLPSIPSGDSQLSMSAKMIDRPAVATRINHNAYKQYQQEYCLISEYNMLRKQDIPGVYVIPSAHSSLLWFGVIFVRQGLYQGGVFRFKVLIPDAFPDGGCPVVFESPIFHPAIHKETGELDVQHGFHEWRKNVNHIWQILHFLRRAFIKFETKTPVNEEAFELFSGNPLEFRERAKQCVRESQDHVYDSPPTDDPHYICFEPYNEEVHGPVRDSIFKRKEPQCCMKCISKVKAKEIKLQEDSLSFADRTVPVFLGLDVHMRKLFAGIQGCEALVNFARHLFCLRKAGGESRLMSILNDTDQEEESSSLGLSWVQPGSLEPFSKPDS